MDDAAPRAANPALLADARAGLCAPLKSLPPKWLYDARGSALFERITALPEYDLTRVETTILRSCAPDIAASTPPGSALVELGSGASTKTRILLDALPAGCVYVPVDISTSFLAETARALRDTYADLDVYPVAADFTEPFALPLELADAPKIGFFPGSTIGNLPRAEAVALLRAARRWTGATSFVLGADLVRDPAELVAAYDDAQGVTAAFIGNVLHRLREEAGVDVDPRTFTYRATWDAPRSRIDMELVSRAAQVIDLAGTPVRFDAGEAIHVSASRKFTPATLEALARDGGWRAQEVRTDPHARFAVAFLVPDLT